MTRETKAGSRLEAVTLALRDMILSGQIPSGSRVPEVALAERFGVSRTPVRLALQVLEAEGLVSSVLNRGFTVRSITLSDVLAAFDVRGTLEGLACRLIAEQGIDSETEKALEACVVEGAELIAADRYDDVFASRWSAMNHRFHLTIMRAPDIPALSAAHDLVCRNPLVGPSAMAFSKNRLGDGAAIVTHSQAHHHAILDAVRRREGARAEALAREHMYDARQNLQIVMQRTQQPFALQDKPERASGAT
jgi:GntR family transcriptional regulator, vanillate catabolism transcriptional regulator